jgi:hypothetical protein
VTIESFITTKLLTPKNSIIKVRAVLISNLYQGFNFDLDNLLNVHSVSIAAFTNVQPEVLMAWQNEIYGWQHPNTLTMPFELVSIIMQLSI